VAKEAALIPFPLTLALPLLAGVAGGTQLTYSDALLEQSSQDGAFDLALSHPIEIAVEGDPGAAVLLLASVTPPPSPPPQIGGVPFAVDPGNFVILVNGLADPAAVIGPGGTFSFGTTVPGALPPGGVLYTQALTVASGTALPKLSPGVALTIVDARIFEFDTGLDGFGVDLSDYHDHQLPTIEPVFGHATLPAPLDPTAGAVGVQTKNVSDDLFVFLKRKITGLAPSTARNLRIEVRFASNEPVDSVGIGGSPGASVILKAGGAAIEPLPIPLPSDPAYLTFNLDKGDQSVGGSDLVVIGNIGTPPGVTDWTLLEHRTPEPRTIQTDGTGALWICVGTDSGYEGVTTLFYDRIVVKLLD
jgi:hypothetical protein